jgi:hypothetical protein
VQPPAQTEGERNALRAAIEAARPPQVVVTTSAAPSRSPADILRERMMHKGPPQVSVPKPPQPVQPVQPKPQQQSAPSAPEPRTEKENDNAEIPYEELRRIVYGGK